MLFAVKHAGQILNGHAKSPKKAPGGKKMLHYVELQTWPEALSSLQQELVTG